MSVSTQFEPLLTTDEAAGLLKIHPKTLQNMARQGRVPCARMGKYWFFRASVLNDWVSSIFSGDPQCPPSI